MQEAQPEQDRSADSTGTVKAQGKLIRPSAVNSANRSAMRVENEKLILRETAPISYVATASEGKPAPRPQPEKASASQVNIDEDEIYFTRTVVVKAAVQYQSSRYDIDTVTDPLIDMDYDESHYSVSVLDDGGFNGSRIGEYHIIYSLDQADNGGHIADLERYIWITAPGVTFDAPELQLRLNQTDFDLQEGISYDSAKYTLTAADPDSIDTSQAGEQRVMFIMRERTNADEAPTAGTASLHSESPVQPKSQSSDQLTHPMSSAVSLVPDDKEITSFEAQPIAAEFGRNVKVTDGPVVVIDAPPLVIMEGSETQHSLLEGAEAEDEDGNPVKLQVADRSELDQAAADTNTLSAAATASEALKRSGILRSTPEILSENPEALPENPELPATLPPGTYQVLLAATHPVTGETFTMQRLVRVTDGKDLGIIRVTPPGAISSGNPVKDCSTIADALAYITSNGQPGKYTVSLQQDYAWVSQDAAALQNFTARATEVVFSGLPTDTTGAMVSGAAKSTLIFPGGFIYLPKNSPVSYTMENMKISTSGYVLLLAQCSPLTMGDGLETSGGFSIYGRGFDAPVNGDLNLTIKSGTYDNIYGSTLGGTSAGESGNTYITVKGGNITNSIWGTGGLPLTGDVYVTVEAGTVGTIYADYVSPLNGDANVTIKGGTVNTIYGGNSGSITGHIHITVEGGSIGSCTGGSMYGGITPPHPSEKAVSVTVRGGTIGTLYGGGEGPIYGAGSYVELHGGKIGTLYGGGSLNGQSAASPADIVVSESGTAVDNVYAFDSLTVTDGRTFAPAKSMISNKDRAGLGAIKLGAGSTLSLPATGNIAGTLAATGAGSRLVLGRTGAASAPLTLYGTTAPDVAAGRITLAYPEGTVPAAGDKLIHFNSPSLADVNDYIDGIWHEDLRGIHSNPATGDVYLADSTIRVVPPGIGQAHPAMSFDTAANALAYITSDGQTGSYTVSLLKDYTLASQDTAALENFTARATEVVFSGLPTDQTGAVISGAEKCTLTFPVYDLAIYLPKNSPISYTMENMKISSNNTILAAQCSPLTMGEGLEISGSFSVYGRGGNAPVNGDVNLVIKSGTYKNIWGGSDAGSSSRESGNSYITVKGGDITGAIDGNATSQLTGDVYITVEAGTLKAISGSTKGSLTGDLNITINGGNIVNLYSNNAASLKGNANVTINKGSISGTLYGNYTGWLTGDANITINGGTVNQVHGNYTGTIAGHTHITVKEGSINTLSGGSDLSGGAVSAPHPSEKAVSVTVRGGTIGTLYGGRNGSIYGAGSYVELHGGKIGTLYGGGSLYSQPAASPADIVVSESGAAVDNVYAFDSLTVTDGQTFAPAKSMISNTTRAGLGAVKLGAGSTLSLPATGNIAGTLAATGAGSRLVLGRTGAASAPLTLYGTTAPDVAAGRITLACPEGTAPASGDKLIHFNSPSLADANDYIDGIWHEDLRRIYSNPATGYVYLADSTIRVVPPGVGQAHPAMSFDTAANALAYITSDGQVGSYTVSLLKDYTWASKDGAALENFTARATEVVFSGLPTDITGAVISGAEKCTLRFPDYGFIYLPKNSPVSYTVENMKIPDTRISLVARCSVLTMGEGLEMSGYHFDVYGRGYNTPVNGVANLTIKSGIYAGIFAGSPAGSSSSESGNSYITVKGGYVDHGVYGAASSSWTGDVYVTVEGGTINEICGDDAALLNGDANVTIKGGNVSFLYGNSTGQINGHIRITVEGGSIGYCVCGSETQYGKITPPDSEKAVSIIVRGGTIDTLWGGGGYINGAGSYVELHGGKINGAVYGGGSLNEQPAASPADIVVSESGATVDYVYGFDSLTIADGQTFAPAKNMNYSNGRSGQGAIKLGAGSTLSLTASGRNTNTAGTLTATGAGSKLVLSQTGESYAPLILYGNTAPDVAAGKITLAYPDGTTPREGDKLIRFSGNSTLADVAPYENGFGNISILANKTTGYVYLGCQVTLQTDGGAPVFYGNLAAVMNAIGTGTGDYTVTFRKEGYTITDTDKAAMAANGAYARSITYTSGFTLTFQDPLEPDDYVGRSVTRTVNISGDFGNNCPTYLDNIRLNLLSASPSIYANGHPLYIGTQTAPYVKTGTVSMAGNYPDIYGGSENGQVESTDVVLADGQFNDVYGGGKNGAVTGDTSLVFRGNANLYGSLYGGGQTGAVGGRTGLRVEGGTARKKDTHLVAGGRQGTAGSASLSVSGGTALSTLLVGGAEDGNVAGDVQISITESSGPVPSAASADIYGSIGRGNVGGAVTITINNGKNYGIISGGSLGTGTVTGPRTVNFNDAQVKISSVRDFDALNLGPEKKTTLTFSGSLSGSGALNFYNGSMLNLSAAGDQRVGSIAAYTEGASHLHIGKAADTGKTNPLHITGVNTSSPLNRLTLGFIHDEAGTEKLGDNLLVFDDPANAKPAQYISDTTAFDIVLSTEPEEPGTIEFGLASTPHIKEYSVRHTDGEGGPLTQPDVAGTTRKTLDVVMTNFGMDGQTYVGRPIQSAYVDNTEEADPAWIVSGVVPGGVNAVTVTRQPGSTDESPVWDGTAVIDVTQPQGETPRCYFIHVRDGSGANDTRALDLESPVNTAEPTVARDALGNYTFKITFTDPVLAVPGAAADSPLTYTAAGLRQFAWSVGDASGSPGRSEALAADMVTSDNLTVTTPQSLDFASYDWTFEIPAEKFGDDPSGKVVYLYAKDKKGNTRELALPMNENLIDVTVPARVGLIALKGGDQRLLKPACYVVNNSPTNSVKAEIVGAQIPAGELAFVTKAGGFGSNEMNLSITNEGGDMGNVFTDRSVADITNEHPLDLGLMPPASRQNHGDYFTFDAKYDPVNINETGSWSLIKLSYRFTLERGTP